MLTDNIFRIFYTLTAIINIFDKLTLYNYSRMGSTTIIPRVDRRGENTLNVA